VRPRGKRLAVLAAAVAIAIPLAMACVLRHRIREEWLLHTLDAAGDDARRFEILEEISHLERISDRGVDRLTRAARDQVQAALENGESQYLNGMLRLAIQAGGARALSAVLESGDENYLLEALKGIGWEPLPSGAVSGMLPLLAHESDAVRVEAIETLKELGAGTEDVVLALSNLLGDPENHVRWRVEDALRASTLDVETLLRHFTSIALDPDPERRPIGIRLLANLVYSERAVGPTLHSIVLAIAGGLEDASGEVRQAAGQALSAGTGPAMEPALPALIRAIERNTHDLDFLLIDALAGIGRPAVSPLVRILEHRSAMVRHAGVLALNRMEGDLAGAAVPALIERLSDIDPGVRETACNALGDLESAARPAGRALREHLDDGFESIRNEAACALWRVTGDGRAAAAVLKETVLSQNENIFRASVWTLARIGPTASAAVPNLRRLLHDERCSHRLWAADAVARILDEDAVILERLPSAISCACTECPQTATDICVRLGERALAIVPAILELLRTPSTSVRTHALRCLDHVGPAAEPAVLAFLETTAKGSFERLGAEEALRQIRSRGATK
jgi:HEAT repeat protein